MQVEHANDRLVPVTIFEVHGTQLSTSWRTGVTFGDHMRPSIEFLIQFRLPWFVSSNNIWFWRSTGSAERSPSRWRIEKSPEAHACRRPSRSFVEWPPRDFGALLD